MFSLPSRRTGVFSPLKTFFSRPGTCSLPFRQQFSSFVFFPGFQNLSSFRQDLTEPPFLLNMSSCPSLAVSPFLPWPGRPGLNPPLHRHFRPPSAPPQLSGPFFCNLLRFPTPRGPFFFLILPLTHPVLQSFLRGGPFPGGPFPGPFFFLPAPRRVTFFSTGTKVTRPSFQKRRVFPYFPPSWHPFFFPDIIVFFPGIHTASSPFLNSRFPPRAVNVFLLLFGCFRKRS